MVNILRPVVISGPSGCGKSTLLKKLLQEYPHKFGFSVSHTTRKPRLGESQGIQYNFTDRESFLKMKQDGKFIETAEYSDNFYGTSFEAVKKILEEEKIPIIEIELQGIKTLKSLISSPAAAETIKALGGVAPSFIFIAPPSLDILEERLVSRGTETKESLNKRLHTARIEMEYAQNPNAHDKTIVNNDLEIAYKELKSFLLNE